MGTLKKSLVGGAVIAAALAGGAYYTHNYVIPEKIALELNSTFDDVYQKNKITDGLTINKSDDIKVIPAGFLQYKASFPELKFDQLINKNDDPVLFTLAIDAADYSIEINDKADLVKSAINDSHQLNVSLVADGDVSFNSAFIPADQTLAEDLSISSQGTCNDVVVDSQISNRTYEITVSGNSCDFSGAIKEQSYPASDINMNAELSFLSKINNDGHDIFSGKSSITFEDIEIIDGTNAIDKINIDKINMGIDYDKLPGSNSEASDVDIFKDALYPEDIKFTFNMTGLQIPDIGGLMPQAPEIDLNAYLDLNGLKDEKGTVAVGLGYDIKYKDQSEVQSSMFQLNTPLKSQCDINLNNVPMKSLSHTLSEVSGTEYSIAPGAVLNDGALLEAFKNAGISVQMECLASTPERYSSFMKLNHKYENGSFPGNGKFELRGAEEVIKDLETILGPDAESISAMFLAFAEPTDDGKGLRWQYSLESNGNLTVNNQPLGPVLPSSPPMLK